MTQINFTTPVGRLVQGDLYTPNTKDAEGRPLTIKHGPSAGQARVDYYVALAIPKVPGQHWASSDWGSKIWQAGHAFMAAAGQVPAFAWKVRDGDSTTPNRKGRKPCEQEGFPGHWILGCSSGFAPKIYTLVGQREPLLVEQKDAVNLGDYVQINGNVDGNGSQQQPGVFVNMNMVCLVGYGQRIVIGPDVASAGFGGAPLPAGASLTPPAGFSPPTAPAIPGMPAAPAMGYPSVPTPAIPAPPAIAPSSTVVAPNPAFLAPQAPGVPMPPVPGVPGVPGVPQGPTMLPAAQGIPYADYIGNGWTDALLRQHGMMV